MSVSGDVLPYRSDPAQLLRWVDARARGYPNSHLREREFSAKSLEGTLATAAALGLLERDADLLTPQGQRLALADPQERMDLLRAGMRAFPPYGGLLEALAARSERSVVDVHWIETWWATHRYGSSQSNRAEGTSVLGRFVEFVGWGEYVPGRRGYPTRIRWSPQIFSSSVASSPARTAVAQSRVPASPPGRAEQPSESGYNRLSLPLRSGGMVHMELPHRLSAEEKRRLLDLLDLLIVED